MWDFIKSNKFKILLCLIAMLLGVLVYSASFDGVQNIPKNLLRMITTPFEQMGSSISKGTSDFFNKYSDAEEKSNENEELKKKIAQLNQQLIDYENLKKENEQLKEYANIKENHSDYEMAAASVVSRNSADPYSSFVIDKGEMDGIAVGDPVITNEGLVGVVIEVSSISSRVSTIFSPDISVSCIGINSKDLGIISGNYEMSESNTTKMELLGTNPSVRTNEIIATAGAGGLFPADLPIGTVKEIRNEKNGMSKYAVITPYVNIQTVESVYVITSFYGQGNAILDGE